jgi:Flp pilus assembly protein TadD
MKPSISHPCTVVLIVTLVLNDGNILLAQETQGGASQTPDIYGGALSLPRPGSPPVRPRPSRKPKPPPKPKTTSTTEAPADKLDVRSKDDLSDELEDALALGNAARDKKPPDYQSAERAYKLAAKLISNDPRPYIGLGNIYYDQKRFAEAAGFYKKALDFLKFRGGGMDFTGGATRLPSRPSIREAIGEAAVGTELVAFETQPDIYYDNKLSGRWHAYLGRTLLRQGMLREAESVLRIAVAYDYQNAEGHVLLGYALFEQKRYTEASDLYKNAAQIDSTNGLYKELLDQALTKSKEASSQDDAITRKLKGTKWEIASEGKAEGTCRLKDKGELSCKFSDDKSASYSGMLWKIEDNIFQLYYHQTFTRYTPLYRYQTFTRSTPCFGKLKGNQIDVECYISDESKWEGVWIRKN